MWWEIKYYGNDLFEWLSSWKKWVNASDEWIQLLWENTFYTLRNKWISASEILELTPDKIQKLLNNKTWNKS